MVNKLKLFAQNLMKRFRLNLNRTVVMIFFSLALGGIAVGFGQACGKGQKMFTTKVRAPKPLPPPDSLEVFQPPLAPHLVCKVYLTSDTTKVFRTIDTVTSQEIFDPTLFPADGQNFTIDCSDTTSQVTVDNTKMKYTVEFDDLNLLATDQFKMTQNKAPKFSYAFAHGTYVGRVTVEDSLGLKSIRGFLMQVKCADAAPIELDMDQLEIKPVSELDRTAVDQMRATGDRFEFNAVQGNLLSQTVTGGVVVGINSDNFDKYAYNFDFNGDGIFDPYKDGRLFKTWREMLEPYDDGDSFFEEGDGIPFNSVYTYMRGQCNYVSSSQTCQKDATGRPIIDTHRTVKVRVLDTECNLYAEGTKSYDSALDESGVTKNLYTPLDAPPQTFYNVAGMIPNQFGAMFLVADWLGLRNQDTGTFNDDKRIHNIHYVGVTPLKIQLTNEDRFLFRFNRGIGFTGLPRQLTQVTMQGSSRYNPTDINHGKHGMNVDLLFQDLTTDERIVRYKGVRMCTSTDSVYNPAEPRIITPCIKNVTVFGGSMNETSGVYATDIRYAPSNPASCTVDFELDRRVPGTPACLLSGGEVSIFPSSLAPQNPIIKEGKSIKWTVVADVAALPGELRIYKRGTSEAVYNLVTPIVNLSPSQSHERFFTEPGKYRYDWVTQNNTKSGFIGVEVQSSASPTPTPSPSPIPQGAEIGLETGGPLPSASTLKGFAIKFINKATTGGAGTLSIYKADMANAGALVPFISPRSISRGLFTEVTFLEPAVYKYTWSSNSIPDNAGFIAVLDEFDINNQRPYSLYIRGTIKCDSLDNGAVEPEGGVINFGDAGPNPIDVKTKKGFKVKWANKNTAELFGTLKIFKENPTVSGGYEQIDLKELAPNQEHEFTFANIGKFKYTWNLNNQQKEGFITVIDAMPTLERKYMKFESGQFYLRMGDSEKGICEEPGPGPGDDGPPPAPPAAL